jgi:hypothetical protein
MKKEKVNKKRPFLFTTTFFCFQIISENTFLSPFKVDFLYIINKERKEEPVLRI